MIKKMPVSRKVSLTAPATVNSIQIKKATLIFKIALIKSG
jgi:hypothetical protein